MKKARSLHCAACAIALTIGFMLPIAGNGADVVYTEPPADTSSIGVSGGTSTMVGVDAFRHLRNYWSFDDASDLTAATVGSSVLMKIGNGEVVATNDVKRGTSAIYLRTQAGHKVDPIPSFITATATKPFSVSFWLKGGQGGRTSSRIFYFGAKGQTSVGTFLDLMYQNNANLRQFYWFGANFGGSFVLSEENTPKDRWVHVAVSCVPTGTWQADGSVSNVAVTLYFDGVNRGTRNGVLNAGDDPILCIGTGFGPSSPNNVYVQDTIFDEFMIFDKALDADEVSWIAENTRPYEFSAGWDIARDGVLDIAGSESQIVRGTGVVTTDEGLMLAPTTSSFFGGTVAGASLSLSASAAVTQTIAVAASYTGATTVASGTLKLDPARALPALSNTLVAYYSCDDPEKPCRDDSGNGNDLYRENSDATVQFINSVAGGALYFPNTGDEYKGYVSPARMNGFSAADNSFMVAAWVRMDARTYREGFFSFGSTSSGLRINNTQYNNQLYYGDAGALGNYVHSSSVADGNWRHFVLVYDSNPGEDGIRYRLFVDGTQVSSSATYKSTINHAAEPFYLGKGMTSGDKFKGAVDEVFVLNGANTNDVTALYNYRRSAFEAGNAAAILPAGTTISVDAGATLFITNSCESVKELRGAGTVYISSGSSLCVRRCGSFTGDIVGGGRLLQQGAVIIYR